MVGDGPGSWKRKPAACPEVRQLPSSSIPTMLKRQRSVSSASSSSSASTSSSSSSPSRSARPSASPASKHSRLPPSLSSSSHTCSLPPTCDADPPTFASADEVESHYRKLHSLVCECEVDAEPADGTLERGGNEKGKARAHQTKCGAIFPEQRLMDLVSDSLVTEPARICNLPRLTTFLLRLFPGSPALCRVP